MTIYQGITKGGNHIIHCDRLDEFFKEFVEYRKWKSTTNNFNKDNFPFQEWKKADGNHPYNPEEDYYWKIFFLNLDNDKAKEPIVYWERPLGWETSFDYSTGWDLGINVSRAFKIKKDDSLESSEWKQWNQQKEKIKKILKDIWITGKIKDTYGLDLNWPNSKRVKTAENSTPELKDKTNESINEQPSQENNKIYWIIGSLVLVSLVGLIIWLFLKNKTKNKQ